MIKNPHFSNTLKIWYLKNKRQLPWRKTKNPYLIWLSEIILQQTRIDQGTSYYIKFSNKFPNVKSLANANEDEVLKLWQGLGYYSRARNLHKTAIYVAEDLQGLFPDNYDDLIKLKGVGDYTASAIASICFHENKAVVDGNVYRFLSRYFGISTPINSSKGNKEFKLLAENLIDGTNPGDHNQAIMEFGALTCKPLPLCTDCPYSDSCIAFNKRTIKELPVKEKKIKIKKRYFNYLVIDANKISTVINRRTQKDIWQNLFDFPLFESTSQLSVKEILKSQLIDQLLAKKLFHLSRFNPQPIIHKLTHQHLYATFWVIETKEAVENSISWEKINTFAFPILIKNFIDQYQKRD